MPNEPRNLITVLVLFFTLVACADDRSPGDATGSWNAEEEVRGDTVIIRTLSGSVWGDTMRLEPVLTLGELDGEDPYVFGRIGAVDRDGAGRLFVSDRQAGEIRVFDSSGVFVGLVGSSGEGPGEYREPDDLRITPDGELIVRDQRGARFLVYSLDGEHQRSWRLGGVFSTSEGFHLTDDGRIFNPDLDMSLPMDDPGRSIHVAYDVATGEVIDSLTRPRPEREPARVEVSQVSEGGVSRSVSGVPFHASGLVARTPSGGVLQGLGSRYALIWERADGSVLQVERAVEAEPVQPAERAAARNRIEEGFRAMDPGWQWNGPSIPESKPPFRWTGFGPDGSLWVLRHTRAVERENPEYNPDLPWQQARLEWFEPPIMDVFDRDGRYLGPVVMPETFSPRGWMVFDPESPVLIVPHELGYDQVVRYRMIPSG